MSYKIECNPESHEIYIRDDEGNVVHHSHTIEQQRAALAMFIQETRQLQLESKGQQCRRTYLQNCHICDDVGCCDNTSMAKKEIDRLRSERDTAKKELAELKAKLPKTADGVTVVDGMEIWRIFDDGVVRRRCPNVRWGELEEDYIQWEEFYSTCEAAEQAAREAGEGAK